MKTKTLFGLVAAVAVTGFAASAHAGWSVNVSLGLPAFFPPPVVVTAPPCPPPVVACPPVVLPPAPVVVYQPVPVYPPVVYSYPVPRYGYYGYYGYGHGPRGWGNNDRGYNRVGHR
jgi:hypothetical protein